MDSGATVTISGKKCLFKNLHPCFIRVRCANGEIMTCTQMGTIIISHNHKKIIIKDALFIPRCVTLISVNQLTSMGLQVLLKSDAAKIFKSEHDLMTNKPVIESEKRLSEKLWTVPLKVLTPYKFETKGKDPESAFSTFLSGITNECDPNLLHARYAHFLLPYLKVKWPHLKNVENLCWCDACASMMGRRPYRKKKSYVKKSEKVRYRLKESKSEITANEKKLESTPEGDVSVGEEKKYAEETKQQVPPERKLPEDAECKDNDPNIEVYQVDLECKEEVKRFGRYFNSDTKYVKTESVRGYRYLFIVVDKDTRVTYGFLGVQKSDFAGIIKRWIRKLGNVLGRYPAYWKFDSGTEFLNHTVISELEKHGITLLYTTTAAHNQNSYSERKIGVIWKAVKKVLAHSGVPMQFWCYCAIYVIFILNHLPHSGIDYKIPFIVANMVTKDHLIRTFGCEVWFVVEGAVSNQSRCKRGVLLGLSNLKMGYDILDIESRVVIQSRNIYCNETRHPFKIAMKPCFIQLDFGTWPTTEVQEEVSVEPDFIQMDERGAGEIDPPIIVPPIEQNQISPIADPDPKVALSPIPAIAASPQGWDITSDNFQFDMAPELSNRLPQLNPPDEKQPNSPDEKHSGPDPTPLVTAPVVETNPPNPNRPIPQQPPHPGKSASGTEPIETNPSSRLDGSVKISDVKTTKAPPKVLSPNYQTLSLPGNPDSDTEDNTDVLPNKKIHVNLAPKKKFSKQKPLGVPSFGLDLNEAVPTPKPIPLSETATKGSTHVPPEKDWWEVEKVLDRKRVGKGYSKNDYDFLVKWKGGFSDSWIPGANIKAKQLLDDFNQSRPKKQKKVVTFKDLPTARERTKPYNLRSRPLFGENPLPESVNEIHPAEVAFSAWSPSQHFGSETTPKVKSASSLEPDEVNEEELLYKNRDLTKAFILLPEENPKLNISKAGMRRKGEREILNFKELPRPDYKFTREYAFNAEAKRKFTEPIPKPEFHRKYSFEDTESLEEILQLAEQSLTELLELDHETLTAPKNRTAMLKDKYADEYIKAELRELQGIHRHGTFEKVVCPANRTPITCRWVYDLKRDGEGKIVLFKARLVVHGFKQQEGVDFNKTFSSTAQIRTFRFVVAIAILHGLKMTQYDISNAFLNGKLDEEIYMEWPPGYPSESKDKVIKLIKGLYGLKQASRIWQQTLYDSLKELNIEVCKTESGVLRCTTEGKFCLVVAWVDDLIVITKDEELRAKIEAVLKKNFLVKCLGELSHYVGIVLEREKDGIFLHQKPYNTRVVKKFPVKAKYTAKVPAKPERLSKVDCPTKDEDKVDYPYINVTGSLLYSTICTRPDLFFSVMQLARFNSNPGREHVKASEQVLKYLANTLDLGIKFRRPSNFNGKIQITAFVDSDWAGCPDTRRSTMGYVIHVAGGPVSFKSKLMPTIAHSSCEAEFVGLTEVCREIMWMCRFLDEIGLPYETPEIFCDSTSAINWAEDPVQHQRNKHVELKYYYVRDCVAKDVVKLFRVHTTRNLADIMTKPVGSQILERHLPAVLGYEEPIFEPVTSGN